MDVRDKYKLKVLQSNGLEFQQFFSDVMTACHPGFQSVKPHGNIGDRGNDGWIQATGSYYQVYAPEDLPKNTKGAIAKAKADFKTLYGYWNKISPIKSYYFVVNDRFNGVSPHISNTLAEIKLDHNLTYTGVMGAADLERLLFSQSPETVRKLLGLSETSSTQLYDDQKNVRTFLDKLSLVFQELFTLGREAGYFFPSNVIAFIPEWCENDWEFKRLLSKNSVISHHQINMQNQLIAMYNQVTEDHHYKYIGLSFKFSPPHELKNREMLIEDARNSMETLINNFASSYNAVSEYSA